MDYNIQKGKTIILKSIGKVWQINIDNIVYISCDSYLLSINLIAQKEPIIITKPLKEVEEELKGFSFLRINRKELINMKYFKSYHVNGERKITMSNSTTLAVSRRKWSEIKNRL